MRALFFIFSLFFILSECSAASTPTIEENIAPQEKSVAAQDELDGFGDEFAQSDVYDPLSGYNRWMTSFNDTLYIYALRPIAKGYKKVLHEEIRKSIANFFTNLTFPVSFVNNVLQGKLYHAVTESARFSLNSTIGIGGLFDPAKSRFDIEPHKEDFGQTLGFYGVGGGVHIVLPLLGPSNARDLVSMYPDSLLKLIDYEERSYWTLTDTPIEYIGARSLESINTLSLNLENYEKMRADAVDLYPFLRDVYEQYRENQIKE